MQTLNFIVFSFGYYFISQTHHPAANILIKNRSFKTLFGSIFFFIIQSPSINQLIKGAYLKLQNTLIQSKSIFLSVNHSSHFFTMLHMACFCFDQTWHVLNSLTCLLEKAACFRGLYNMVNQIK